MASKPYNLKIDQGATFSTSVVWQYANGSPKDLTGYTARMQVRSTYASNTVVASLTTSNGEITITPGTGKIDLVLADTRTSAIPVNLKSTDLPPQQTYVYDLELVSPASVVTRLLYGQVVVTGEVTR